MRLKFTSISLILLALLFFAGCKKDDSSTSPNTSAPVKMNIQTTTLDWGVLVYGQSIDKLYTFVNDAGSGSKLTGTVKITGDSFYIVNGSGTFSLLPGASRTVKVRFLPSGVGSFSGTLIINHNASNRATPLNVILAGSAH